MNPYCYIFMSSLIFSCFLGTLYLKKAWLSSILHTLTLGTIMLPGLIGIPSTSKPEFSWHSLILVLLINFVMNWLQNRKGNSIWLI